MNKAIFMYKMDSRCAEKPFVCDTLWRTLPPFKGNFNITFPLNNKTAALIISSHYKRLEGMPAIHNNNIIAQLRVKYTQYEI